MNRDNCNKFDTCSAPICPLSPDQENNNYIFYPDEEICTKNNVPAWVRKQRKIVKVNPNRDRYYTLAMLKHNCIIGKGIDGLNPDLVEEPQLKQWFKKHPNRKQLTESERQKKTEHLKKHQFSKLISET